MSKSNKVFWGTVTGLFVGVLAMFCSFSVFGSTHNPFIVTNACFGNG